MSKLDFLQQRAMEYHWSGLTTRCGALITRKRGLDTHRAALEIAAAVEASPNFYPSEKAFVRLVAERIRNCEFDAKPALNKRLDFADLFRADEFLSVVRPIGAEAQTKPRAKTVPS